MNVGYVFESRVSAGMIQPISMVLASLLTSGRTLRKCYLFSCRYKNVSDIGIRLKPNFYKKCQ